MLRWQQFIGVRGRIHSYTLVELDRWMVHAVEKRPVVVGILRDGIQ